VLTGEAEILTTDNGKNCFLNSIRLLVRVCPNITVAIPRSCTTLLQNAMVLSKHISFGRELEFRHEDEDMSQYDAVLSVGSKVRSDLPWTTINSNGWIARVTSGERELCGHCDLANPIAALGAACLGVGEIFKRLIRLRPERGEVLNGFSYSLLTYQESRDDTDCGPALPEDLATDLLVVGAGAIGNGLVHLISQLPFTGRISVIDLQNFEIENLGTCILVGPDELEKPKAVVLAEYLKNAGIDANGFPMPFEQFVTKFDAQPEIVINGLDNIDVRHQVQRSLWPDVVIDGAIGDFTCQVSRHPWPDDIACLICLFRKPDGRLAEDVQSEETGISVHRLANPDALITESDIDVAPVAKQDFLRSRIGRSICSVIQEAMAQTISQEKQREAFAPSTPFVACFSACMVVSEVVAHISGWTSKLEPRFQFDFLVGPARGQQLPQARRPDCICGRRKNIEMLRASRVGRRGVLSIEIPYDRGGRAPDEAAGAPERLQTRAEK
jgi:molybdopterin/thiamine biosynthesis adenylyltransferase